jgi:(2Fe-2S) ferredoxin
MSNTARKKMMVLVCRGTECGGKRDSAAIFRRFEETLRGHPEVNLKWQSCFGQCQKGVNVMVREVLPGEDLFFSSFVPAPGRGAVLYHGVTPPDVDRITVEHVAAGRPVEALRRRA